MWRPAQINFLGGALIGGLAWILASSPSNAQEVSSSQLGEADFPRSSADWQSLQTGPLENAFLREQLAECRRSLTAWADNAAEANAEAELYRRQYESLKLRMEALGLATVSGTRDLLEQRLLGSVRDLSLVTRNNHVLNEQLLALSEAVFRHLQTKDSDDESQSRLNVEAELRATSEVLGKPAKAVAAADSVSTNLKTGSVLGYKDELSLLVTNFGSVHGVKVGMPITVTRGNTFIGRARVVQVRERISGAVFEQDYRSRDQIRVGDQLRVNAFNY